MPEVAPNGILRRVRVGGSALEPGESDLPRVQHEGGGIVGLRRGDESADAETLDGQRIGMEGERLAVVGDEGTVGGGQRDTARLAGIDVGRNNVVQRDRAALHREL